MEANEIFTISLKPSLSVAQARDLGFACFDDASSTVDSDNEEEFDVRSERLSERAALMTAFDLLLVPQSTSADIT